MATVPLHRSGSVQGDNLQLVTTPTATPLIVLHPTLKPGRSVVHRDLNSIPSVWKSAAAYAALQHDGAVL